MPAAYVVKTVVEGQPFPGVFGELKAGRARIGWSYQDNLDLRLLLGRIEQGKQLNEDERAAKRCLGFLARVESEDYLLYPHQPVRGQFSVVQVTGEYDYSTEQDGLGEDFRSFRPCLLKTPEPVDMYDEIVPSQLRHRLGRPGRFSQVYDTAPLFRFLEYLHKKDTGKTDPNRISEMSLQRIHDELREKLPEALHREFSRADLSRQFCRVLFDRMGYTTDVHVQEGPYEAGSDVVVTVDNPLLPGEFRIGVQVFSYEGDVQESALQPKLDQLLRGWETNSLNYGVLLTTGRCSEAAVAALRNHNKENPKRRVRLIEGDDLADLFLKHFPPSDLGLVRGRPISLVPVEEGSE